jgi:hypothetical protein
LEAESYYALNDREILNISDVYGAKFSPDGRLLFQPSTNGIDVFDGILGNLLNASRFRSRSHLTTTRSLMTVSITFWLPLPATELRSST